MNLYKSLSFLTLACFISNTLSGQVDIEDKLEKFQAQKVAFITAQLKLSPKEAEMFWPVYNEFDDKKQLLNLQRLKLAKRYKDSEGTISEKEASELADKFVDLQKQEALLAVEYNTRFKTVLPAAKVLKLYQAEVQFKRELLKKLRQGAGAGKRATN
jgi:hypothetical protein